MSLTRQRIHDGFCLVETAFANVCGCGDEGRRNGVMVGEKKLVIQMRWDR
jgi:hypothetical protein